MWVTLIVGLLTAECQAIFMPHWNGKQQKDQPCDPTLKHVTDPEDKRCAGSFFCDPINKKCVENGQQTEKEGCWEKEDCQTGMNCIFDTHHEKFERVKRCVKEKSKAKGQECASSTVTPSQDDTECQEGLQCDPHTFQCAPLKKEHEECIDYESCEKGLYCMPRGGFAHTCLKCREPFVMSGPFKCHT